MAAEDGTLKGAVGRAAGDVKLGVRARGGGCGGAKTGAVTWPRRAPRLRERLPLRLQGRRGRGAREQGGQQKRGSPLGRTFAEA